MNKIPFKEVCDINLPEELFGRDSLLNQLVIDAKLKHNVNIIGARRFGKTCLAMTACTLIKRMDISVYPVYINSKADIQGTSAVYRYMIGVLVESLYKDGIFTESEKIRDIDIFPTDDWTEIAEKLEDLSASRIQSLFQKVVYLFSDLMDKTILFIIDEYEYLLKYALDTTAGFMKIRTMSAETLPNGSQPFCFWLIGATSWDNIITQVPGSGETNTVTAYEYVGPISKESFFKMWDKECSLLENMEQKSILKSQREYAYEKSGGVPFFGKVIGANILRNNLVPDYTCCLGHLQQMSNKALNEGSYNILKELAVSPKKLKPSKARNDLRDKGIIIEKEKETFCIAIGYLKDYIFSDIAENRGKVQSLPESYTLMKAIAEKIELINKQRINYKKKPIFKLVIDYSSLENDLSAKFGA